MGLFSRNADESATSPTAAKVDAVAAKVDHAAVTVAGEKVGGAIGDAISNTVLAPIRRRV
jgi:hypothetical protein